MTSAEGRGWVLSYLNSDQRKGGCVVQNSVNIANVISGRPLIAHFLIDIYLRGNCQAFQYALLRFFKKLICAEMLNQSGRACCACTSWQKRDGYSLSARAGAGAADHGEFS